MEGVTLDTPSWLDIEFVEKLLRENEEDCSIVVSDFTVSPAVGKGDNYSSCLHRVAFNMTKKGGCTEPRSLIVKSLPASGMLSKLLVEGGIVDREKRMYSDILPALHKLTASSTHELSSRAYKTGRPHTIVLDDLTRVGYKMADRRAGLDLQHTKMAARGVARLHALSMGLAAHDPASMDSFSEPFYTEEKKQLNKQFNEPAIKLLASCVETWETYERFADSIRNVDWIDVITELVKVNEGDLVVLNHGDTWTNNMLFQYDETGEVQTVKFVDFQLSRYASPALDILYFMHTSPSVLVREQHWDDVIEEYYHVVVETLKAIGCESKVFSYRQLTDEIKAKMLFGLFTACMILPIVLADPGDAPDFSNMSEDSPEDNANKADFGKAYNAPRFKRVFKDILTDFDVMGIL